MKWKEEAIEKLRRYPAMKNATQTICQELEILDQEACAVQSAQPGKGGQKNLRGREDRLINIMVKRQELELLLSSAENWVRVTEMALQRLTQKEQDLLCMLYMQDEPPQQACARLAIDRSSLYRHRDAALKKLTLSMYGALES